MTLKSLVDLSGGDEEKAVRIVEQSIMRQWQGLFPLHIPSSNGKSTKKSTSNKQPEQSTFASQFKAVFVNRHANGESQGDGINSKAV